jgi:hypothetical protein
MRRATNAHPAVHVTLLRAPPTASTSTTTASCSTAASSILPAGRAEHVADVDVQESQATALGVAGLLVLLLPLGGLGLGSVRAGPKVADAEWLGAALDFLAQLANQVAASEYLSP